MYILVGTQRLKQTFLHIPQPGAKMTAEKSSESERAGGPANPSSQAASSPQESTRPQGRPSPTTLYSPGEAGVQRILTMHSASLDGARVILQKVAAGDSSWKLQQCEEVVERLRRALGEGRRFLLYGCRRAAEHFEVDQKIEMLSFHAVNCAVGMLGCGEEAGLEPERLRLGALGGLVHNFGMALVPEQIVSKPGTLSRSELKRVREHPLEGSQIPQIAAREDLARIVAQSRERIDGSGYPRGLEGEEIDPLARYVHAVDVFEALTQPRSYREGQDGYSAMKIVNMAQMSSLWPEAVKALIKFYTVYPVGTPVELNTGERGKVVETDRQKLLRPVVAVLSDPHGKAVSTPTALNLAQEPRVHIKRVIEPSSKLQKLADKVC